MSCLILEVEILIPFRTVAAVDAMPDSERMGDTVDELSLYVMEDLVGHSAEELGSVHVVEFEIDGWQSGLFTHGLSATEQMRGRIDTDDADYDPDGRRALPR